MSREQERMLTKHGIEWLDAGQERLFAKFNYVKTYGGIAAMTVHGVEWVDVSDWSIERLRQALEGDRDD